MISLEQIRLLENKINKSIELIRVLREENRSLRSTLDSTQTRIQELETLVNRFKAEQQEIENCIVRAIKNLDHLEDEISEKAASKSHPRKQESKTPSPEPTSSEGEAENQEKPDRELEIF